MPIDVDNLRLTDLLPDGKAHDVDVHNIVSSAQVGRTGKNLVRPTIRPTIGPAVLIVLALLLSACGNGTEGAAPAGTEGAAPAETGGAATAEAEDAAPTPDQQQSSPDPEVALEEGMVQVYAVWVPCVQDAFKEGFEEKYPGITVDYYRANSGPIMQRVLTEAGAGEHSVDILGLQPRLLEVLDSTAAPLASYESPESSAYAPEDIGTDNKWVRMVAYPMGIVYNKGMVSEDEVPSSFEELIDPKWKGQIAIQDPATTDSFQRWYYTLYHDTWGEERTEEWLRGLAGLEPVLGTGPAVAQSVASGDVPLGLTYVTHVLSVAGTAEGESPLDFVETESLPAFYGTVSVSENAPHPNAARLFEDYVLSEEGAERHASCGYPVTRPGVPLPPVLEALGEIPMVEIADPPPEELEEFVGTVIRPIF